jgi:predicted AlkP superfamily phosphohydrolase/phosphomutase
MLMSKTDTPQSARTNQRRVLVIGLDGATYRLIKPMQAAGELPNLSRLMNQGAACTLQSTIQPSSEQAWATFMTGLNNGRHGVFGFQQRRPGAYQFDYVNGRSMRGQTLWGLLSQRGRDVIVINVPMTYPPEPVRGVLVGGLLSPGVHSRFTYPDGIVTELRKACGDYVLDVDTERGRLSEAQLAQLAEDGRHMIRLRTCATLHLAQTRPWDFCMVVYGASDRLAHKFWKYWDTNHPLHDPGEAKVFGDVLPSIYRELDHAVGQLLDALWDEATTVFVLSDHGFGPMEKAVYLNRWLMQQGYLVLKPDARLDPAQQLKAGVRKALRRGIQYLDHPWAASAKRWAFNAFPGLKGALYSSVAFAQVDWSQTRAYAVGTMGNIYLNRQDREPQGTIAPGPQADALAAQVIDDLRTLVDPQTGAPVFHSVYRGHELYEGPALADAPDIVAVKDSRYHVVTAEWQSGEAIVAPLGEAMHFASDQSGQHELPGILIAAGPHIRRGQWFADAQLVDMAATILYAMGEAVPTSMDSKAITALFEPEYWQQRPPQLASTSPETHAAAEDTAAAIVYTDEEQALLQKHLAGLGYLD